MQSNLVRRRGKRTRRKRRNASPNGTKCGSSERMENRGWRMEPATAAPSGRNAVAQGRASRRATPWVHRPSNLPQPCKGDRRLTTDRRGCTRMKPGRPSTHLANPAVTPVPASGGRPAHERPARTSTAPLLHCQPRGSPNPAPSGRNAVAKGRAISGRAPAPSAALGSPSHQHSQALEGRQEINHG